MDDETLKIFAYVNISSYRVRSVKALKGEVKTPTDIARDADIKLNHISKVLSQLKDCGVAVCLNEEAYRGRMKFSGFMNVYLLDDMSWEYQFADRSLKAATLEELELLVNLYGLKWNILDENLAKESLEIDRNNHTGFLNVYFKDDTWYYRGSDLKATSLQVLKKRVLAKGLEWKETDSDLAYKTWKLDLRRFEK